MTSAQYIELLKSNVEKLRKSNDFLRENIENLRKGNNTLYLKLKESQNDNDILRRKVITRDEIITHYKNRVKSLTNDNN